MNTLEDFPFLFFAPSETSRAAGKEFWARRHRRSVDNEPPISTPTIMVQLAAGPEWAEVQGQRYAQLAAIKQAVLVVMLPTVNSFIMQQIPNAQLIPYPDKRPP